MTQGIRDFFNLPPMEDVLREQGALPEEMEPDMDDAIDPALAATLAQAETAAQQLAMVDGKDHAEAMDTLHKETLKHARDVMELGFNIDQMKAARMFEVATGLYGKAMEAKNAKRDAQLKTLKLALEQRRIEALERQGKGAEQTLPGDATVVVEDRNELIRALRAQMRKDNDEN